MLHSGLPLRGMGDVHSNHVRLRFHTLSGGKESDGGRCCAGWGVGWANDQIGHVGLFEDILFRFALIRVTSRRDKCWRVLGHVGHKVPVAEWVRPESSMTGG
jgi:hypothetical protein